MVWGRCCRGQRGLGCPLAVASLSPEAVGMALPQLGRYWGMVGCLSRPRAGSGAAPAWCGAVFPVATVSPCQEH